MLNKILLLKRALRAALLVLLLNVAGMTKVYADTTIGDLTYDLNNTTLTATVWGHVNGTSATGALIIPETVTYTSDGVTRTYSVTTIGGYAFCDCRGFTGSLTIPNSVTTIGLFAFCDCSGFTGSLTIPNSVTAIGSYAFYGCSGFTGSLTIPNSVTTIGTEAFSYCSGFTGSLTIGNSVTTIGNNAFNGCSGFTGSLTIGNSVTTIGNNAFNGCSGFIGSLTIPNSVTTIGGDAFSGCSGFTGSLTIPNSVTTIGGGAFSGCSGFAEVHYNATNCAGGFSFEGCGGTLFIGEGVERIPDGMFSGAAFIGNLTIPNSVTSIGTEAFSGCSGFSSLVLPENLVSIGSAAFYLCGGFRGAITLPETLETVGPYAFASCDEVSIINYNAINCTQMGNAGLPVFYDCISVNSINIGENVQSIPNYAFKRCSTVVDMNVAAAVPPTIGSGTFGTVSRSIPVSVPYGSGEAYRTAQYWEEFFNITEDYTPSQYTHHWSVNFHQFENSMTVIGLIQIDGVEQATDALEIGAFVGEECRGRQLLAYYAGLDHYLVFLTLYGEDGEELGFRLYDHEANEELPMGCTTHITFETDATIGTLAEPYPFNFTNMHVAQLAQGWNWWSTYVEQEGIDGLSMLEESLGENGITIKSQNGYVQYMPDYSIWYGSTGFSINNETFYMVQTNAPCEVEMTGAQANPTNHPITLATGWNWIGYPCTSHMSFANAFSGVTPSDNDQVKSQGHGFASYMEAYGIWYGTLAEYGIDPGMGLMYKSNNGSSFSFTYPNGRYGDAPTSTYFVEDNHWTADYNAYPNNMTVTAVVELDDVELNGDNYELAAFADGECRGSVRLMYVAPLNRYMAFLTVAGDESAELTFGLYNTENGAVETVCTPSLQYETNAVVGSLETPYVIRFRSTTGVDDWADNLHVFPNPAARGENITLGLTADEISKVQIEIINALGVVESLRTTSVQTITAPDVAGVYTLRITVEGKGTCYRKLVVR